MRKQRAILGLSWIILGSLILSACGVMAVQVQPVQPAASATPTVPPAASATAVPTLPTTPIVTVVTPTTQQSDTPAPATGGLKPGTPVQVVQTKMLTDQSGWGIGTVVNDPVQYVLFTSDGGRTWQDRTPSVAIANPPQGGLTADAYFASADLAWVVYASQQPGNDQAPLVVWRTTDGGQSWLEGEQLVVSDLNMEFQTPSDLGFSDDQHGWVMVHLGVGMSHDYFAIFTSADGGNTWKRVLDPNTTYPLMGCYKSGLAFTGEKTAWLTGNCPGLMPYLFLYRSQDGGVNWEQVTLPAPAGKPADYFAQNGIGCGIPNLDNSSSQAVVLTLNCTNFSNNSGQAWMVVSTDNGATWTARTLPLPYTRVDMLNASEGFLVGSLQQGPEATGAVYHTVNGGTDWTLQTTTAWTGLPDFVDASHGWVVASHNQETAFVASTDGGKNWIQINAVIGK